MFRQILEQFKYSEWFTTARQLRRILSDAYPSALLSMSAKKRKGLVSEFAQCGSLTDYMEFARRHTKHGSIQIPWEIESTIAFIAESNPHLMCEIGTFDGGTSLLFNKYLPSLDFRICIDLYVKNKSLLKLLAPENQSIRFVDGSSYSLRTVAKVSELLQGRSIDVLFIDGDHRYEGVKADFLAYRSFVREGGFIMFHDIVPDRSLSSNWTGGVPLLWRQLRDHYPHCEYVQADDQDGYGIGILTYSRTVDVPLR